MNLKNLISELKRRNVFKVATAYAIAGWLIIQIATSVFPVFNFPDWTSQFVIILVGIGFPISLIIAWAFELTAEGLKKTDEVKTEESITPQTGRKINTIIIATLSIAVVFLLVDKFVLSNSEVIELSVPPVSSVSDKSIAVLPFDDFNAGGDQEYFADGLTEEILNVLAKTPDLKVSSRTSSFQFKDRNTDITEVAKTLGVAHILEGSVRQSSSRIRVTAQLIRASDGFHLWSENYDRQPEDIIQVQEDIAFKIATALETAMDPEALAEMVKAGTKSVEAYNSYIAGVAKRVKGPFTPEIYNYYEEARQIDPTFAEAHYNAASFWSTQIDLNNLSAKYSDKSYSEKLDAFNERMTQAIKYGNSIDQLKYSAIQSEINLQYREAMYQYQKYLDQRPGDFSATNKILLIATALGDRDLVLETASKALKQGIQNPVEYIQLIFAVTMALDKDQTIQVAQKALEVYPYSVQVMYQAHRALLWGGEFEAASELVPQIVADSNTEINKNLVKLRQACADGNREEAVRIFKADTEKSITQEWLMLQLLNEKEEAKKILMPIYENNEMYSLASFLEYPYFDATQFPRLQKIIDREEAIRAEPAEIPFACK